MATPCKLKQVKDLVLADFDAAEMNLKDLAIKYEVTAGSMRLFLQREKRILRGRTDLRKCNQLSVADSAYIAGLIDGDGCLTASIGKSRTSSVVNYKLIISMCDLNVVEWITSVTNIGFIYSQRRKNQPKWKDLNRYECASQQLNSLLEQVIPYLKTKKNQALLLQELGTLKKNKFGGVLDRGFERQAEIVEKIQALNFRGLKQDAIL